MKESLWDKDGLLFMFNYGYTKKKPERIYTTRCQLFWRTVILSPLAWFGVGLIFVFMFGLFFPIFFLFGVRPSIFGGDDTSCLYVSYKKWPIIFGHRILPIVVMGIVVASYLLYLSFSFIVFAFTRNQVYLFVGALIVLLTYGMVKLSKIEIGSLFWSHLIEKKNGWCPNVRFVNKEELLEARKEKN